MVKRHKYFTEVVGQLGKYTVEHQSIAEMNRYHKKLRKQWPYFRKVRSGKLEI